MAAHREVRCHSTFFGGYVKSDARLCVISLAQDS